MFDAVGHMNDNTTTSGGTVLTTTPNDFGQVVTESWSGGDLDGVGLTRSLDDLRRFSGLTVTRQGATLTSHSRGYDGASRVKTITQGTASATYAYLPQTSLLDSVTFKQGANTIATADHDFDLAGHLKWIKYTNAANAPLPGSTYTVDDIHRRTKVEREDGSWWDWGYNSRSEVTSASRKFADATLAPMEQFSYTFDATGNRLTSTAAGREATYVPTTKNQYASRTNPGYLRVSGEAEVDVKVVINATLPDGRKGREFWREQAVSNSAGGVLAPVRVVAARPHGGAGAADLAAIESGLRYVPPAAESFSLDDDGNLTADARWAYTWDAENRLIAAEERSTGIPARPSTLPRQRLEFKYDATSRRTVKKVLTRNAADTAWEPRSTSLFIWDGWNMVAELESGGTGPVVLRRAYTWGLDISGSLTAAGGFGGLVFETQHSTTANSGQPPSTSLLTPCYDGNGNVLGLLNAATGAMEARYEYDAFGNVLRATGPAAKGNPIRFSAKYNDVETGLVYYGFRYYAPELGRWLSRDPIEEDGGINLYGMCGNDCVNWIDMLGMKWKKVAKDQQPKDEYRVVWQRDSDSGTLEDLAKELGLDPSEKDKWTQKKGDGKDCPVSVPNIWIDANLMHGGGFMDRIKNLGGILGRAFTFTGKKRVKIDHAKDLVGIIQKHKHDIIGFSMYAHGGPDGTIAMPDKLLKDQNGKQLYYTDGTPAYDLTRYTDQPSVLAALDENGFKLAKAYVMQCYSGFKGTYKGTKYDWASEWSKRVFKSPMVYQGVNALGIDIKK